MKIKLDKPKLLVIGAFKDTEFKNMFHRINLKNHNIFLLCKEKSQKELYSYLDHHSSARYSKNLIKFDANVQSLNFKDFHDYYKDNNIMSTMIKLAKKIELDVEADERMISVCASYYPKKDGSGI